MRNKVSWEYFEFVFNQSSSAFCQKLRSTYKGYYLTAIDGDQYTIERNLHTTNEGYKGQKCGKNKETFGLKMFLTIAVDMISGSPLAITASENSDELTSGLQTTTKVLNRHNHEKEGIVVKKSLEKHIFTYDRLYFCGKLIELHKQNQTNFIVRCKRNGTFSEVSNFVNSGKSEELVEINGMKIRILKAIHEETAFYYATNILDENISIEQISWIYLRRWESETTNCHGVKTIGIEKFHTNKINGMKQEIFASFWTLLISKSNKINMKQTKEDFDKKMYRRQNTKRVYNKILDNLVTLFGDRKNYILNKIESLAQKTTRIIKRISRRYERMRKYQRQKKYPQQKALEILTP